jgi:hypothetical protein
MGIQGSSVLTLLTHFAGTGGVLLGMFSRAQGVRLWQNNLV